MHLVPSIQLVRSGRLLQACTGDECPCPVSHIRTPADVEAVVRAIYPVLPLTEHAGALFLNHEQRIIARGCVAQGDEQSVQMTPILFIRPALQLPDCRYVVAGHTHTWDPADPSDDDHVAYKRLLHGLSYIGVELWDFVITAPTEFYSFREADLLKLK